MIALPAPIYGIPRTPCSTFCAQAATTWNDLVDGWDAKIPMGEETLTDNNLLAVYRAHYPLISHIKFDRFQEHHETGADWEWWFATLSPARWFGIRFQAKKLNHRGRYASLNTVHGRTQGELLVTSSMKDGLFPMYVFYNAWRSPPNDLGWLCRTFPKVPQLLGCAVSPASVIGPMLTSGATGLAKRIAGASLPWSCLVCCDRSSAGPLPDRVASMLPVLWPEPGNDTAPVSVLDAPPSYLVDALGGIELPAAPDEPIYARVDGPVRSVLLTIDPSPEAESGD